MKRKWKIALFIIFLFGIESIFPNFFPEYLFPQSFIFVPRFLLMFLILLAAFYDWKKAVIIAALIGAVTDIVFIEILGIYVVWYPLVIYIVSRLFKLIHNHLVVVAILTLLAISLLEYGIYGLFFILRIHHFTVSYFVEHRLLPTLLLNLLVYMLIAHPLKKRFTLWKKEKEEEEGMFQS